MRTWLRLSAVTVVLLFIAVACGGNSVTGSSRGEEADASISGRTATQSQPVAVAQAPAPLRMAVLHAQQRAPGYDFVAQGTGALQSRGGSAAVKEDGAGVRMSGPTFDFGIATASVGRTDGTVGGQKVVSRRAEGQELVLSREDAVEERFLAGPVGLEQSFSLQQAPKGQGSVVVQVAFDGLAPELVSGTADRVRLRDAAGSVQAWYTDLVAVDATGRALDAKMEVNGGAVSLVVDDAKATYPIAIDPVTWAQQAELTPGDGATGDLFGTSVALSEGIAIVGAPSHTTAGGPTEAGAAYIFVQSGTSWTQQAELTASDAQAAAEFGAAVAVNGTTAVVGAPFQTVGAKTNAGSAYVFVQSGTTWTQQAEVTASDVKQGDGFGTSVAVNGTTAIVGSPGHKLGPLLGNAGAAYVYVQSGTTWPQQAILTASDAAKGDAFGFSVAVTGTTAFIGAYLKDGITLHNVGAAYVFTQSGAAWSQLQELTPGDAETAAGYGYSVAASGTTAIIGSATHDIGSAASAGAAYVYVQGGSTWTLQQELTATDDAANDNFGWSVAVNGQTAVVGAVGHTVGTNAQAGTAYVYLQSGTTWSLDQELSASDDAANDLFGSGVATSGTSVLVGASQHAAGAAYVFAGTPTTGCYVDGVQYASGAPNPANVCQECTPATSSTSFSNDPDGTSCGTSVICITGSCVAGCFISGAAYTAGTVNPANACQVCTPATTTTGWSNVSDGTTCSDGNACTQTDTCSAGTCTGTNPVTCTASDQCHTAGTCNPASGTCSNPAASNGTACNDGNACTQSDTCQTGTCTGTNPVTCTASDQCHTAGTCDPSSGACSNPTAANGTTCNDGNGCTQTDTCQTGTCTGGNPVTCTASDQCHTAGTCNPASGTCSNPIVVNGTACNDTVACTANDVCTNGACGGTPYTCVPGACQAASVCNGTGTCTITNAGDGTSCGVDEVCVTGTCVTQDGGTDAGTDSGTDAGTDSGTDAGTDGGSKADAGTDGGSAKDAGSDGGTTVDAGHDAGPGDGGGTDGAAGDGGKTDGGSLDSGTDAEASNDSGTPDAGEDGGLISADGSAPDATAKDGSSGEGGEEDAALGDGGDAGDGGLGGTTEGGGCGCTTAGSDTRERPALLGLLGLAIVGIRRRRRGKKASAA